MKVLIFSATGMIGQRVLAEALQRGHDVTAVVRDPAKVTTKHSKLHVERGDLFDPAAVQKLVAGQDVVVSAFGPPAGKESQVIDIARTLVKVFGEISPSPRLISVGGAGGLEVAPGVPLISVPSFPAAYKVIAQAAIDAYEVYKASSINWTFFAPAAVIQPGERTGKFRTGSDQLIADAKGNSSISAEDYAVALLDEIEKPQHLRGRMTVGY